MLKALITIIISIPSAVLITIGIFKFWFLERIKRSVEFEYSKKLLDYKSKLDLDVERLLHDYKSKLDLEAQRQLIETRNNIEKNAIIQGVGNKAFEEINKISMEKKVGAVHVVWQAVIALRTIFPPIATLIDTFPREQFGLYTAIKNSPNFDLLKGEVVGEQFKKTMSEKVNLVEEQRIYLGEYVWNLYHALMTIMMSCYLAIHFETDDEKVVTWYENSLVKGLVEVIFSSEELNRYQSRNAGKQTIIRDVLERKILEGLTQIISSEKVTEEALKQAEKIQEIAKKMDAQQAAQRAKVQVGVT